MLIILVSAKVFRVNLREEADGLKDYQTGHQKLEVWTLRVTQPEAVAMTKRDIRAPQGGRIVNMQVFGPGAVIEPGKPILDIVPQDDQLVVEA